VGHGSVQLCQGNKSVYGEIWNMDGWMLQVFPKDYKKALKQIAVEEEAERRAREEKENLRLDRERNAAIGNTLQVGGASLLLSCCIC
jgi:hypothetical protein